MKEYLTDDEIVQTASNVAVAFFFAGLLVGGLTVFIAMKLI